MLIYAILWAKGFSGELDPLLKGMKGISDTELSAIISDDIAVVVSNVERAGLVADRASAIEYAAVIETLSRQFALLPMRFGSIMESTTAILKMIERNAPEIQQNLKKVENKMEFGLKLFCDSEKLKQELLEKVGAENSYPKNSASETNISVFRDYINRKLEAHRMEEMVLSHVDVVIAAITTQLVRLNVEYRFKKLPSETLNIDATFLLEKSLKEPLIHAIEELQLQYRGFKFMMTGPWPPYNFVDFTIK